MPAIIKWTPDQLAQIERMCTEGMGNVAIASVMGCTKKTITYLRRKHGFATNAPSSGKKVKVAKKVKEGALKPPAPVRKKTPQPRLARHRILWATQSTQKDGSTAALVRAYLRMTHSNVHDASIRYFDSYSDKRTWADVQNERFGLGIPDHGKGWSFVSGIGVVDDNTLMELAERKGFNREELAA